MSIIGNNSIGTAAFRQLLKRKGVGVPNPAAGGHKNKLMVEYTRTKMNGTQKAKTGTIWYFADIKHWDSDGHLNTGTSWFLISLAAERLNGIKAVEAHLNKEVAEKMKLLLDLKKNT